MHLGMEWRLRLNSLACGLVPQVRPTLTVVPALIAVSMATVVMQVPASWKRKEGRGRGHQILLLRPQPRCSAFGWRAPLGTSAPPRGTPLR
jgi:hypothetical protein